MCQQWRTSPCSHERAGSWRAQMWKQAPSGSFPQHKVFALGDPPMGVCTSQSSNRRLLAQTDQAVSLSKRNQSPFRGAGMTGDSWAGSSRSYKGWGQVGPSCQHLWAGYHHHCSPSPSTAPSPHARRGSVKSTHKAEHKSLEDLSAPWVPTCLIYREKKRRPL